MTSMCTPYKVTAVEDIFYHHLLLIHSHRNRPTHAKCFFHMLQMLSDVLLAEHFDGAVNAPGPTSNDPLNVRNIHSNPFPGSMHNSLAMSLSFNGLQHSGI